MILTLETSQQKELPVILALCRALNTKRGWTTMSYRLQCGIALLVEITQSNTDLGVSECFRD